METIFFGNGINRLIEGYPSWNILLDTIAGKNQTRPYVSNNILEYEGIIANKYKNDIPDKIASLDVDKYDYKFEQRVKKETCNLMLEADIDGKCSQHPIYKSLAKLKPAHFITTNYDNLLLKTYEAMGYNVNNPTDARKQEKIYSIRRHYTISSGNEPPIIYWPIHGEITNARSMMFGLDHYCGSIGKIGQYLKGGYSNSTDVGFLKRLKNSTNPQEMGIQSWIDLFFISDIHIVGFGFGCEEIDLWWILNRRYRLFMQNNNLITNKIIYYGSPSNSGVSDMLRALGVDIKSLDHSPLYQESFSLIQEFYQKDFEQTQDYSLIIPQRFTLAEYRRLNNLSNITARRNIAKMLENGEIIPHGTSKTKYYTLKEMELD